MKVLEIGRLQFKVSSRSRPTQFHDVDLEKQSNGKHFHCTCERFELSTEYHGQICAHIEAAVEFVLEKYYPAVVHPVAIPPVSTVPYPRRASQSRSARSTRRGTRGT